MAYRIIIIILLAAVLLLLCWVIRLHRRLDHTERELDIALRYVPGAARRSKPDKE